MKHVQNPRRGRSRGGPGKRHPHTKNRNYESGGEAKVRGNAKQILDKYQVMARDAAAAGEHILAEGYWQHAEHYYRVLNVERDNRPVERGNDRNRDDNGDKSAQNVENGPQANQTKPAEVREIPIETPAVDPTQQTQPDVPAQPVEAVKPVEQEPSPEVVKPKRRGRPRKVAPVATDEPDGKDVPEPASA